MPEELTHPGFIARWKDSEKIRGKRCFEQYQPFIHTDGLNTNTAKDFLKFLAELYNVSYEIWEPTRCRSALSLEQEARKIFSSSQYQQWVLRPRRFLRDHYWLDLTIAEELPLLIIDPFGIPDRLIDLEIHQDLQHVLPYFGPIEIATENARRVYLKGEPMDDWGTRDLPPGFHP